MKLTRLSYNAFKTWFADKESEYELVGSCHGLYRYNSPGENHYLRCTDEHRQTVGITFITKEKNDILYIELFEVAKSKRGLGYGRRMFEELIRVYQPKRVELTFPDDNKDAKRFWNHIGFHKLKRDGELYANELYMNIRKKIR